MKNKMLDNNKDNEENLKDHFNESKILYELFFIQNLSSVTPARTKILLLDIPKNVILNHQYSRYIKYIFKIYFEADFFYPKDLY